MDRYIDFQSHEAVVIHNTRSPPPTRRPCSTCRVPYQLCHTQTSIQPEALPPPPSYEETVGCRGMQSSNRRMGGHAEYGHKEGTKKSALLKWLRTHWTWY